MAVKAIDDVDDSERRHHTITQAVTTLAKQVACEVQASAIIVCADKISTTPWQGPVTGPTTIYVVAEEKPDAGADLSHVICVPFLPHTRTSRVNMGVLLALGHGLIEHTDIVVCLAGAGGSPGFDTAVALDVGKEFGTIFRPKMNGGISDIRPEVFQRVLEIAMELGREGREGNPIGAMFILGDTENVLPQTHQLVLNPFQGYGPERRNVLDLALLGETIKEFSTIDGAFVVRGDGVVEAAGAYVNSSLLGSTHLPQGLGARHTTAAAITSVTECVAICVSHSTGNVSVFHKGRIITEIPKSGPPPREWRQTAPAAPPAADLGGERGVIVGGGISGLSIALRLAEIGLPVTLLEAGELGQGATALNQGWLLSGAVFARSQPRTARLCYECLQRTLRDYPDCAEPETPSMVFLISEADTDARDWTDAWNKLGIPHELIAIRDLKDEIPALPTKEIRHAIRLPDRSIRTDLLVAHLAADASRQGVTLRTQTPVARLLYEGDSLRGVVTSSGEEIIAGTVVVLAGGTMNLSLYPSQLQGIGLVKSHLIAMTPALSKVPLCILDQFGFNHLPHGTISIVGAEERWVPAVGPNDDEVIPDEIDHLWRTLARFCPTLDRDSSHSLEWAGTTVRAVSTSPNERLDSSFPGVVSCRRNGQGNPILMCVFPAYATLWPHLAEQVRSAILVSLRSSKPALPRWMRTDSI